MSARKALGFLSRIALSSLQAEKDIPQLKTTETGHNDAYASICHTRRVRMTAPQA